MLGDDWMKLLVDTLHPRFKEWLKEAVASGRWSIDNPEGKLIPWNSLNGIYKSYEHFKKPNYRASSSNIEFIQYRRGIELGLHGCYVFGWGWDADSIIPRYVGQTTKQSFVERLRQRYIRGPKAKPKPWNQQMCNLAAANEELLKKSTGWKGFSDEFLIQHFKKYEKRQMSNAKSVTKSLTTSSKRGMAEARYLRQNAKPSLRLKCAEDFARRGIDGIWFALIPMRDRDDAEGLEGALISTVRLWNRMNGDDDILN